jgi:hypothetical protein
LHNRPRIDRFLFAVDQLAGLTVSEGMMGCRKKKRDAVLRASRE